MKEKIHPKFEDVTITCACGNAIQTASTLCKDFSVELCSKCHPFFTGKQRLIDSTGRVERFQKRYEKFKTKKAAKDASESGKQ
ncbi:MAG TPA: 50S ribosomal protein L31 [bacterium]|nr:50S ribosomal protein L31 [bacterium]